MTSIRLEETPSQLQQFVRAVLNGEQIIFTESGKPLVKLVVIDEMTVPPKIYRSPGSAKQLNIVMADDFDEPLDDFAEYV